MLHLVADNGRYTAGFKMKVQISDIHEQSEVPHRLRWVVYADQTATPVMAERLFLGEKLQFDRTDFDHVEFIEGDGLLNRFTIDFRF